MTHVLFGADIGGTAVKLGLFQPDGTLLEKWQIPTRVEHKGEAILPDVLASIRQCMAEKSIPWEAVDGLGLGIPGPVDEDGTVHRCVNLGWDVFNIPQAVSKMEPRLPIIRASNDVNAAALGEVWQGGAKQYESAFMITLGTGIGGGLVVDGSIVTGRGSGAGEIGHLCINPDELEQCSCGGYGCLEQYCSANGLVRSARKALAEAEETPSLLRTVEPLTAKAVCDAAKQGDGLALDLLERLSLRVGWALTAVAGTVDPEVFIIGGGLSNAGTILLERIAFYYQKYAFHVFRDTPFALAKLGNDAGIYGCVRMLL